MSSMHDSPTTREPITAACVIDGTDFCLTHQATHLNTATCLGAPVGFEADCGQPGPHGPHPLVDRPQLPSHPDWCTYEHGEDVAEFDLVTHTGDDHTDGTVRKLLDGRVEIRVARTDSQDEGTVGTPCLLVVCELELTTWEQAAELSRTILDGFGYLAGAEKD